VDAYRKALLEIQRNAVPPPAAPGTLTGAPVMHLSSTLLEDLRAARKILALFDGQRPPAELWEVLGLVTSRRAETTRTALELHRLKKEGQPGEFAGAAFRFRERLQEIRLRLAQLVAAFREFLAGLPDPRRDPQLDEVVVASLVVSSGGRQRVRQWLEDPAGSRDEAVAYVESLRSRLAEPQSAPPT
jgi:hypothetical protein